MADKHRTSATRSDPHEVCTVAHYGLRSSRNHLPRCLLGAGGEERIDHLRATNNACTCSHSKVEGGTADLVATDEQLAKTVGHVRDNLVCIRSSIQNTPRWNDFRIGVASNAIAVSSWCDHLPLLVTPRIRALEAATTMTPSLPAIFTVCSLLVNARPTYSSAKFPRKMRLVIVKCSIISGQAIHTHIHPRPPTWPLKWQWSQMAEILV